MRFQVFYEIELFNLPNEYYILAISTSALATINLLVYFFVDTRVRKEKFLVAFAVLLLPTVFTLMHTNSNYEYYSAYRNKEYKTHTISVENMESEKHPGLQIKDFSRIPYGGHSERGATPKTDFDQYIQKYRVFEKCDQIQFGVVSSEWHDIVVFIKCTKPTKL